MSDRHVIIPHELHRDLLDVSLRSQTNTVYGRVTGDYKNHN